MANADKVKFGSMDLDKDPSTRFGKPTLPDILLQDLVNLTAGGQNRKTKFTPGIPITLIVNGLIVYGETVSYKDYLLYHVKTLAESLNKGIEEVSEKANSQISDVDVLIETLSKQEVASTDTPRFIHLKNVRLVQNGHAMNCSSSMIRVRMDSVDGFFVGLLPST